MKIQLPRLALLMFPIALLLSCSAQARIARPALWKVSSPTATIYLLGTIHALPVGEEWHTPAITKAEAESSVLVLELSDSGDQAKLAETVRSIAFAPGQPDVLDRVPPAQRPALQALLAQSGAPLPALKAYKTWAVYLFALNPLMLKTIGLTGEEGVERKLTADFTASGKSIEGLETVKYQLGIFDALPEATQRHMLAEAVADFPKAKAEFFETLRAWEAGDPALIAKSFDKDLKSEPELEHVLIHNRNVNWTNWTLARLHQSGTTLVAVGAGHLAGDDSVIAMLRAKGLKVVRVE